VRRLLAIALLCAAASGCGGAGNNNNQSGQLRVAIDPEAQARAGSMLFRLTDFPDGWRAYEPEREDEERARLPESCVRADYSAFTVIGDARSDDFGMGGTARASSQSQVFESEQMAAGWLAEFAAVLDSEEADTCMTDLLRAFSEDANFEITGAEVGELSFTPPPGVDEAHAWQVEAAIEGKAGSQAEGLSVTAYADFVQLRNGDVTAEVSTTDIATPFDSELRDQLVAAVAARMSE
jgi:hypothetical protein